MRRSTFRSHCFIACLLLSILSGFAAPRASANQAASIVDAPEFRIGVSDDRLTLPDVFLAGYTELDVWGRPEAAIDPDSKLTVVTTASIFALYLVRVLGPDNPPDFFDSPDAEQTILGSERTVTEALDVRPRVMITIADPGADRGMLEMAQVPGTISFNHIEEELEAGETTAEWLEDGFRPGFPVARGDGKPAQAVVTIPFTFPDRSTYVIYAPDASGDPEILAVYQAVARYVAPGCDADDVVSVTSGECEPSAGNVQQTPAGGCFDTNVTAFISRNAISFGCEPENLGLQSWAIVNTTDVARAFDLYEVPAGTTSDQLQELLRPGGTNTTALSELGIRLENGVTPFHGQGPTVYVEHNPGLWAAVSTTDDPAEVTIMMFELFD